MQKEVALKAIDFLCENSSQQRLEIKFFGGEPLLGFDLIKAVVDYCDPIIATSPSLFLKNAQEYGI